MKRKQMKPRRDLMNLRNFTATAEAADLKTIDSALRRRYGSKRQVWAVVAHDLASSLQDDPAGVVASMQERFSRRVEELEESAVDDEAQE